MNNKRIIGLKIIPEEKTFGLGGLLDLGIGRDGIGLGFVNIWRDRIRDIIDQFRSR